MKKVITIGYEIPAYSESYRPYDSNQSLLDADIIVFEPNFDGLYHLDHNSEPYFQGKPCYDKDSSFKLLEASKYWKKELYTAAESGKTVFIFFHKYKDFFVHTGRKTFSGTGRNLRTTNIVDSYDNYQFFPLSIPTIVPREGEEISFLKHPAFVTFWEEYKNILKFRSYLDGKVSTPLFVTKTGQKIVGALFSVGSGSIVLVPSVEYDHDSFTKYDAKKRKRVWLPDAIAFGHRLVKILVDIDGALHGAGEKTPAPDWVKDSKFQLESEIELGKQIHNKEEEMETLFQQKKQLIELMDAETKLKDLLFEKGKPLEIAVGISLRILGYKTENFDDGSLEFDHVITSPEGERYIGETEGKDNSAINIDKFRQLAVNIQEDLERDEIDKPALGILFGNGARFTNPSIREEQFTLKCLTTAKSLNYRLIRTTDLFVAVKYLNENKHDTNYAKACRDAIKNSAGKIVVFPDVSKS